jgi:hypothetical protein
VALGDGLHLIDVTPDQLPPIAEAVAAQLASAGRARRDFTISLRTAVRVDPALFDAAQPLFGSTDAVRRARDAYARAGLEYLVVSPRPRQAQSLDDLEAAVEAAATALLG